MNFSILPVTIRFSFSYPVSDSIKRVYGNAVAIFGAVAMFSAPAITRGEAPLIPGGSSVLPEPVTDESFAALKDQSPFLRSIGLSRSIVVTGVAQMEEGVFASLFDLETRESYFVGEKPNPDGWQLVGIKGDQSDLETVSAQIKVAGSEVVSIRYEKLPASVFQKSRSSGKSSKSSGGGTGPHGGPDPRVLTRDQMADAKEGAKNYREGFHADGYPDKPPASTVAKLSKLSPQQRESINVKMYEYRNRGLGLPERAKIYEGILDKTLQSRR